MDSSSAFVPKHHDGARLFEAVRDSEQMRDWRATMRRCRSLQVALAMLLFVLLGGIFWAMFERALSDTQCVVLTVTVSVVLIAAIGRIGEGSSEMPQALGAWWEHQHLRRLVLVGEGAEDSLEMSLARDARGGPTITLRARSVRGLQLALLADAILYGGLLCREVRRPSRAGNGRFEISDQGNGQLRFRCEWFEVVEGG